MNATRIYTTIDKSEWGDGPWQHEPDKIQWRDAATGLPCLAKRHPRYGHWCGYVGVSATHPLFGLGYDKPEVDCHGGLTYADACQEGPEAESICHVPEPGEPDLVWWFGFDCGHAGDQQPGLLAYEKELGYEPITAPWRDTYKSLDYVQSECSSLALQLQARAA